MGGMGCSAKKGMYRPVRSADDTVSSTQALFYWISDEREDPRSSIQVRFMGFYTPPNTRNRAIALRVFLDNHTRRAWKFSGLKQVIQFVMPGQQGEAQEMGASLGRLGAEVEVHPGPTQHVDLVFFLPEEIRSPSDLPEFILSGEVQMVDRSFRFTRRFIQDSNVPDYAAGNALIWQDYHQRTFDNSRNNGVFPRMPLK